MDPWIHGSAAGAAVRAAVRAAARAAAGAAASAAAVCIFSCTYTSKTTAFFPNPPRPLGLRAFRHSDFNFKSPIIP